MPLPYQSVKLNMCLIGPGSHPGPICFEDYSDESWEALTIPRMIPSCGHTFCEDCLSARLESSPREDGQQPGSSFARFRSSLASGNSLARAAESPLATIDLLAL